MLDGYGNRIGQHPVYMTDYGPVEITDITEDESRELAMHSLGYRDRPDSDLYAAFVRYLQSAGAWSRDLKQAPPAVSFKDRRRNHEARMAILENGQSQHEKAKTVIAHLQPWPVRSWLSPV